MCDHQDHAGVGSALPDRLQYFRIERLKEMGCNAYRTSHNTPTAELLEACDRLGMLVLDETRRWVRTGNAGPTPAHGAPRPQSSQRFLLVAGQRRMAGPRDANGTTVMTAMQNLVHSLDSTRLCTGADQGSGDGRFHRGAGCQGFNYNLRQPGHILPLQLPELEYHRHGNGQHGDHARHLHQ